MSQHTPGPLVPLRCRHCGKPVRPESNRAVCDTCAALATTWPHGPAWSRYPDDEPGDDAC